MLEEMDVETRMVDIEENFWSPRFGLKGKIDVTVEVSLLQSIHIGALPRRTQAAPLRTQDWSRRRLLSSCPSWIVEAVF
jgi:hypothetical protein